jgi:hypothetical protein
MQMARQEALRRGEVVVGLEYDSPKAVKPFW